jgi:predicted TIM-barrel fold metal-dependent hydrolase
MAENELKQALKELCQVSSAACEVLDPVGSCKSRELWGSDWPCTNHERFGHFETLIDQAHEWIDSQAFEQVMLQNPSQLYGFTR